MKIAYEVVLVRPARPANVAAACRAMKNMGLGTLRIVSPPAGLAAEQVRALAWGAWDLLEGFAAASSLAEAVAGCGLVVGTSGVERPDVWSPKQLAHEAPRRAGAGPVALVFGPEASGLTREELRLCHATVRVPTAPEQPSLNLAQAVLLLAYEVRLAGLEPGPESPEPPAAAGVGELETALAALRRGLLGIGYLDPQDPDRVLAELRRLLARARPTAREIDLLRGLARQIEWAAAHIAPPGARADNSEPEG